MRSLALKRDVSGHPDWYFARCRQMRQSCRQRAIKFAHDRLLRGEADHLDGFDLFRGEGGSIESLWNDRRFNLGFGGV